MFRVRSLFREDFGRRRTAAPECRRTKTGREIPVSSPPSEVQCPAWPAPVSMRGKKGGFLQRVGGPRGVTVRTGLRKRIWVGGGGSLIGRPAANFSNPARRRYGVFYPCREVSQ
jgi:hypothetical protein